jgi:predicted RecA/RadA family phage recombinase
MGIYPETITNMPPEQLKFNGEYGFPFIATADELEAGTIITRGGLIGFSNRVLQVGDEATAELRGTLTLKKAAATAFIEGDPAFWNPATKLVESVAANGLYALGMVKITPSVDSETVEVILDYADKRIVITPP